MAFKRRDFCRLVTLALLCNRCCSFRLGSHPDFPLLTGYISQALAQPRSKICLCPESRAKLNQPLFECHRAHKIKYFCLELDIFPLI